MISVRDTGMGMSVDEQQHIFERLFRTELATDRAIQGLGLGLTIVKAIVDARKEGTLIEDIAGLVPYRQTQVNRVLEAAGLTEKRAKPES